MATPIRPHIEQETPPQHTLFLAFELGQHTWKLGFTIGAAQPPRERTIPAGDMAGLQQEILREAALWPARACTRRELL